MMNDFINIEQKVIGLSILLHQLSSSYSYLKDRMMQQEAAEAQAASAAAAAAAVAAQQNAAVAYQTDGKAERLYKIFSQHIFNAYFCQPWFQNTNNFPSVLDTKGGYSQQVIGAGGTALKLETIDGSQGWNLNDVVAET